MPPRIMVRGYIADAAAAADDVATAAAAGNGGGAAAAEMAPLTVSRLVIPQLAM
jgi:hypothetical protein